MKATANSMRASRQLRRKMTPPEVLLWQQLRGSPAGVRFRRQYAIGPFLADFYCPAAKLVIEVDGQVHDCDQQANQDAARDALIGSYGVDVQRIPARQVMADAAAVAAAIVELCSRRPLPPPRSGEETE